MVLMINPLSSPSYRHLLERNSFCFGTGFDMEQTFMATFSSHHVHDAVDRRIVLDYIPILRFMALCEESADKTFNNSPSKKKGQVNDVGRRSTRRTAKRGRIHYFDSLLSQNNQISDRQWTGKRVGVYLAKQILAHSFPLIDS